MGGLANLAQNQIQVGMEYVLTFMLQRRNELDNPMTLRGTSDIKYWYSTLSLHLTRVTRGAKTTRILECQCYDNPVSNGCGQFQSF